MFAKNDYFLSIDIKDNSKIELVKEDPEDKSIFTIYLTGTSILEMATHKDWSTELMFAYENDDDGWADRYEFNVYDISKSEYELMKGLCKLILQYDILMNKKGV